MSTSKFTLLPRSRVSQQGIASNRKNKIYNTLMRIRGESSRRKDSLLSK